jgi:hypothetical protein
VFTGAISKSATREDGAIEVTPVQVEVVNGTAK